MKNIFHFLPKDFLKTLGRRIITTVILTVTVLVTTGLTIWALAAFTEPAVGPASSDQDFAQNILGNNDANNDFDSTLVAANNDGSLIERLQYIWDNRASFMANVTNLDANLDATVSSRLAATSYTAERGTDNASLATSDTVPTADVTTNTLMRDVVGNKTDAAVTTVGTTKSLMGYIKGIIALIGAAADAASMSTSLFAGQQYISDNMAKTRTCGNGVIEAGEGCDDGGTSWTSGACAGDCSRTNYFIDPQLGGAYLTNTSATANKYCNEMGFVRGTSVGAAVQAAHAQYIIASTIGTTGWSLTGVGDPNMLNYVYCIY